MVQLAATLKAKAALPEKEALGHFAASLAESRTSGLCELLEDLFGEVSKAKEEEGPPSKKSQPEDKPSTSDSSPFVPTLTDTPSNRVKVIFPRMKVLDMIKASLKIIYLYDSSCLIVKLSTSVESTAVIMLKVRPPFVLIPTKSL